LYSPHTANNKGVEFIFSKPFIKQGVKQIVTLNLFDMKTTNTATQRPSTAKTKTFGKPHYYFHADEDFREDWDWKVTQQTATDGSVQPTLEIGKSMKAIV
jgi:hypothetical protein